MKRKTWLMLIGILMVSSLAMAAKVKIITQEAMLRKDKRFFAPAVTRIPYGSVLDELELQGDWLRVSYQGKQGWIHRSAVQEQKFDLAALSSSRAEATSTEEVALAGKGFTPEIEQAFRDQNPNMRYDLVEKVQGYQVPENELLAFLRAGNLKAEGAP